MYCRINIESIKAGGLGIGELGNSFTDTWITVCCKTVEFHWHYLLGGRAVMWGKGGWWSPEIISIWLCVTFFVSWCKLEGHGGLWGEVVAIYVVSVYTTVEREYMNQTLLPIGSTKMTCHVPSVLYPLSCTLCPVPSVLYPLSCTLCTVPSFQCSVSMTFWCGFRSESRSADSCFWLMDPEPAIFVIDLQDANNKKLFF